MTPKRRPSGDGKNSRRFATVETPRGIVKIPVVKDAGTVVYFSEDYTWPQSPVTTILTDTTWMVEGSTFNLVDMRPANGKGMGHKTRVVVVAVDMDLLRFEGKFGQVLRRVLVNEAPSIEDMNAALLGGH